VLVTTNRTVHVGVWSQVEGSTALVEEMSSLVRMRVEELGYLIIVSCFQIVLTRFFDLEYCSGYADNIIYGHLRAG
jgi:hypothetical protein